MRTKHLFLSMLALLGCTTMRAYNAKIDGIYYNFVGDKATVTYQSYKDGNYSSDYEGSIEIPESITYNERSYSVAFIGNDAFHGCSNIISIHIPNSIGSIDDNAFTGCSGLTSISIPNSVTYIGYNVFASCTGLTTVTIPNSVTTICYSSFWGCTNLNSVTIGYSVTSIGQRTFANCTSLTFVTCLNPTPPSIYDTSAFPNKENITLYVPLGSKSLYEAATYWKDFKEIIEIKDLVEFADDNVKTICVAQWDTDEDGELSVDEAAAVTRLGTIFMEDNTITSFDELQYFTGLTSISDDAFSRCTELTSIVLPPNVTYIGQGAFFDCEKLASINIPESVTSIGKSAFLDCMGLTSISVESGNSVYDSRDNCNAIIETTTKKLLWGCNNTIIPNSVKAIGNSAFSHCMTMTSVNIPDGVTSIGNWAFYNCESLTSVIIPDNVTTIGEEAFWHCDALQSLTIGSKVTSIGECAFQTCDALTSVTIKKDNPIAITERVFTNRANATLYVPFGYMANYESANYWKEFKKIAQIPIDELDLIDGQEFSNRGDVPVGDLSYSRTYKNTNWQAWYVPFDMTVTDDLLARFSFGKFAGTYTAGDEFFLTVAYLKLGDVMKANTPYFIKAKVADSSNPQVITLEDTELKAADETGFIMLSAEKKVTIQGIYSAKVATAEDQDWYAYGGGLYRHPTVGQTLSPYRFFLTIEDREDNPYSTTPAPAEVKLLVLDDMETSIESLGDDMNRESEAIYDLSGRRMNGNKLNKGIYIINGKKVLVK